MSFRLDRVLTLYFFYPIGKHFLPRNEVRIPILMYHSISNKPEPNVHPYFRINTPPVLFAEHMKFLHDNGYQVISLSTAVDLIKKASNCSSSCPLCSMLRKVVLTFDDGFKDFKWHRNDYDHIVRNEKDLFAIRNYIQNNPLNWKNEM